MQLRLPKITYLGQTEDSVVAVFVSLCLRSFFSDLSPGLSHAIEHKVPPKRPYNPVYDSDVASLHSADFR